MNRIAGIINLDHTPLEHAALDRMLNVQNFQGENFEHVIIKGEAGLGCVGPNRDRINNKTAGVVHSNERYTITFDGRLDNRAELLARLGHQSADGQTSISDQEILLQAYEKWNSDLLKRLIGDYAFAIWDSREHLLFCVRDHLGVKPFYYSMSNGVFAFASTTHALLASGKIPMELNESRIADFLIVDLEGVDKVSTFYNNVFRLEPAHALIVKMGEVTKQCYWRLNPSFNKPLLTENRYVEIFRELFTEAVRCRLMDTAIPSSMLSGGMDSSSIVGVGRQILFEQGKLLTAFGAISNKMNKNRETRHILAVLNQGNLLSHTILDADLPEYIDGLLQTIETEAEPFDNLMNLNRAVYLHARKQGVESLLDGVDGDLLVSDTGYLVQLWRQGQLRSLFGETVNAKGLVKEYYKLGGSLLINSFISAFTPLAPAWLRDLRRPLRYNNDLRSEPYIRNTIIDRDFARRSRLGDRFAIFDSFSPRPQSFSQIETHKIAFEHSHLTAGLGRYERVASSFGIEVRHPFADIRLVEFCLELPWEMKTHRGWRKRIMRLALEPLLPEEVIWRKDKDSLMWEFNRLILKERADYFYQITMDERENLKPYVNMPKLLNFWRDYHSSGDEKNAESLWLGVALAMWLRQQQMIGVR